MKKVVAILLVVAVLGQLLNQLLVVTAFELQRDYIASELCVEKDVQQSSCHGHCQLDKKLTEDTDQQQQSTAPRLEELPTLSLFIPITDHFTFIRNLNEDAATSRYAFLPDELFPTDIFHPPC